MNATDTGQERNCSTALSSSVSVENIDQEWITRQIEAAPPMSERLVRVTASLLFGSPADGGEA